MSAAAQAGLGVPSATGGQGRAPPALRRALPAGSEGPRGARARLTCSSLGLCLPHTAPPARRHFEKSTETRPHLTRRAGLACERSSCVSARAGPSFPPRVPIGWCRLLPGRLPRHQHRSHFPLHLRAAPACWGTTAASPQTGLCSARPPRLDSAAKWCFRLSAECSGERWAPGAGQTTPGPRPGSGCSCLLPPGRGQGRCLQWVPLNACLLLRGGGSLPLQGRGACIWEVRRACWPLFPATAVLPRPLRSCGQAFATGMLSPGG